MIYIHYCKRFTQTASSRLVETVKQLLDSYQNLDTLRGLDKISCFANRIYLLTIKKANLYEKVIIEEKGITISDHADSVSVYFIREVAKKTNSEFVEIKNGIWRIYHPLPSDEVDDFIKHFSKNEINNHKPLPPVSLTAWHEDFTLKVTYDIYETEEWVKFSMNSSSKGGMQDDEVKLYRLALLDLIKAHSNGNIPSHIKTLNPQSNTYSIELNEVGIIYQCILLSDHPIYLLHIGANTNRDKQAWAKAQTNARTYTKIQTEDDIRQNGVKAYPRWVLDTDSDLWKKIEINEETGNMSLMPEQTRFLKDFKFPRYINGQAGSGKSTMLYYLFANAYYYKCADFISGDIIFLTEHDGLLKHTKKSVLDLLMLNPDFDLSNESEAIANVDSHFAPFKDFLLEMLPEKDKSNFLPDKYLNFSKFKTLYLDSNIPNYIKSKYSPELLWFTISTYVYGFFPDKKITSENYNEIPALGKEIIDHDDFKKIEECIIQPFYEKLLEEGYWDKIKLIKYLNQNIKSHKKYEIIFCDEAQDFSRVELDFIMKLSVYPQYNLQDVPQFPVVFAGDALQTVNPTGFRKEVLKGMLFEQLQALKFQIDGKELEFSPEYNYRSSKVITCLANAIQHYRKKQLGISVPPPQKSKRPVLHTYEHLNIFVDFPTFTEDLNLRKKIKHKTIIVPVESEDVKKYIKKYNLDEFDSVLSPVDTKGIDYKEVVIHGFGDYKLSNKLNGYEERFFFNKLYVAVTRAQSELVIIDSLEAKEEFWIPLIQCFIDSNENKNHETSLNSLDEILALDANVVVPSSINDVEKDAVRLREQGKIDENISLLQVASKLFIQLGRKKEYYLCLAEIEEIKGSPENWKAAAEHYKRKEVGVEGIALISKAYWRGGLWSELLKLPEPKGFQQQVHRAVASLFLREDATIEALKILVQHHSILLAELDYVGWKGQIVEKLGNVYRDGQHAKDIKVSAIRLLEILDLSAAWKQIADFYMEERQFQSAIDVLEKTGQENDIRYIKAKVQLAKTSGDPQSTIFWLGKLRESLTDHDPQLDVEIIGNFRLHNHDITAFNDLYAKAYVYASFLLQRADDPSLLSISQHVEKSFRESGKGLELAELYGWLLKSGALKEYTLVFVLERWGKTRHLLGEPRESINAQVEEINGQPPFDEAELNNITELPTSIQPKLPTTVQNITINNFRQFKNLSVKNLGMFNLVVGDNNVGKTSLLEAFLLTPDKSEYLKYLALSHIERSKLIPEKDVTSEGINIYYVLGDGEELLSRYKNHNAKKIEPISFEIQQNRHRWLYQVIYEKSENSDSVPVQILAYDQEDFKLLASLPYQEIVKSPLISFGSGYDPILAQVYSDYILDDWREDEAFVKRMQIFIPQLDRIIPDTRKGAILLRDKQFTKPIPLHEYGDGANKLFRIMLALALHKGKRIMIDEVDAGIHHTKFKRFWKIILEIANHDQTQVIATTHNDECIRYFEEVLEESMEACQSGARIITLMRHVETDEIVSIVRLFDDFQYALERKRNIRGGGA